MSKHKHTPGPWETDTNGNCYYGVASRDHKHPEYGAAAHHLGVERRNIATAHGTNARANAKLIAAAPDLLRACEAVVQLYDILMETNGAAAHIDTQQQVTAGDWVGNRMDDPVALVREAIRKATN